MINIHIFRAIEGVVLKKDTFKLKFINYILILSKSVDLIFGIFQKYNAHRSTSSKFHYFNVVVKLRKLVTSIHILIHISSIAL